MKILPDNFELDRYGLHVRLVREEDASFIVKLRTNPRFAKFLHQTDSDVSVQQEWIKQYKLRESNGEDFYFIFYLQSNPVGVIRIYDVDRRNKKATVGSWVCDLDLPMQIPISTLIICREILFDSLGIEKDCFDVKKGNKHVLRVHKMMGAEVVTEDDDTYYFELSRDTFEEKKKEILSLLNIIQ